MVVGHCGCPQFIHDYIYLFHMPLFFFISGYLFKVDYIDTPLKFISKRIKSCYVPFIKYGLFFLVLHTLFVPLGFSKEYVLNDYLHQIFMISSLSGTEVFLGSYWFLIEMLVASIIFITLAKTLKYATTNEKILLGGVIAFSVLCIIILSVTGWHIPKLSIRTFLAVIYLSLGRIWNLFEKKINMVFSFVLLAVLGIVVILTPIHLGAPQDGGMSVTTFLSATLYLPLSLLGILGLWGIGRSVHSNNILSTFSYFGKNSMKILTWHSFAMAIVLNILSVSQIPNIPPFHFPFEHNIYWAIITIVSITISLVIANLEVYINSFIAHLICKK